MGWYLTAQQIDFMARNVLNQKINYLNSLIKSLSDVSQIVFQSAKVAKNTSSGILDSKKISSYPKLESLLCQADAIVYDSPWKFQHLCQVAAEECKRMVISLKQERDDMLSKKGKKIQKGWYV